MNITPVNKDRKHLISIFFLLISFFIPILQINASEVIQHTVPPGTVLIPTPEELGVESFDFSLKPDYPESRYSIQNRLSVNGYVQQETAVAPSPFAPTGHFESTFIPETNNLVVGKDDFLFTFSSNQVHNARSLNEGITWYDIPVPYIATSVAVSPVSSSHILMGNLSGIQISHDAGKTWESSLSNTGDVKFVVFSPTYAIDKHIFAASTGYYGAVGRLIKSIDGGNTWTKVPVPEYPRQIAIAPNFVESEMIIVNTQLPGIHYSYNSGESWQYTESGLDIKYDNYVEDVIFSPGFSTDKTVFTRTRYGIYRSEDRGATWERFLPYAITDIEFHPNYATNKTFFIVATVDVDGEQFEALFRTKNNGQSFEGLISYVKDFEISADYVNNNKLYAITDFGLVQSYDNGGNWYLNAPTFLNGVPIQVVVSPDFDVDNTVFFVQRGSSYGNTWHSIWKSETFGFTWKELSIPDAEKYYMRIALSPNYKNDKTVILLASESSGISTLYKSVDGGQTWTKLHNGISLEVNQAIHLRLSPNYHEDKTIFVSGYGGGLYRSRDDGQSWQQINDRFSITSFEIAPNYSEDKRIFVSLYNNGISRSDDDGLTWTSPTNPGGLAHMIVLSPDFQDDNIVYIANGGTSGGGVWKSVDAGVTWEKITQSINTYYQDSISISQSFIQDGSMIFTTHNRPSYFTENGGENWYALDGLENAGQAAIPTKQNKPYPMILASDGFYIYFWPNNVNAGFVCQKLEINSPEIQSANIGISVNSDIPAQWRVVTAGIPWLSVGEEIGSQPDYPRLIVDTNQMTEPAHGTVGVDVFLSYRQSVHIDVDTFVPCYGVNLPIVLKE